jgi:hypothetical protein
VHNKDEVTGEQKNYVKRCVILFTPHQIKSRTRYARHIARTGDARNAYKIVAGIPEDLGVDGMVLLKKEVPGRTNHPLST